MRHCQRMLYFIFFILLFLSTTAFAIEEKLAIIRNNANGQGLTLQIYAPPTRPEGDIGTKLFENTPISGNIASFATEDIRGTKSNEFVFISKGRHGVNSLRVYAATPEASALSFHLLADDKYLGRNVRFATLCDCDSSDPEKEVAVIKKRSNGSYQLVIYDLPTTIGGNALAITDVSDIGDDIVGLSAGDMVGNGKDELVIARKNQNDTFRVEVYQPPSPLANDLGLPLLSYDNLGKNIIPNGLAVGDFDDDSEDEIAIVRSQTNAGHSLEIFNSPVAVGDKAPISIASDLSIGRDIVAITAFKIIETGLPHNNPPEAVINANPLKGPSPLTVTLDGGNSKDSEGFLQEYRWEFDNGQVVFGPELEYTYDVPGSHLITLTVTDNQGATDSTQISVEVTQFANDSHTLDSHTLLSPERELMNLINQERQKNNLSSLTVNSALVAAAKRHSEDMAQNNFLSHTGSDRSTPFTRMTDAGYQFRAGGENIAAGYTSPQLVLTAWMNSSGHRRNILNANYCEFGVGYVRREESTYKHYWTLTLGCQ